VLNLGILVRVRRGTHDMNHVWPWGLHVYNGDLWVEETWLRNEAVDHGIISLVRLVDEVEDGTFPWWWSL